MRHQGRKGVQLQRIYVVTVLKLDGIDHVPRLPQSSSPTSRTAVSNARERMSFSALIEACVATFLFD
jgi:hypothetical protein